MSNCTCTLPPSSKIGPTPHSLFFLFPRYCTLIAPFFINPAKITVDGHKGSKSKFALFALVLADKHCVDARNQILLFGVPLIGCLAH